MPDESASKERLPLSALLLSLGGDGTGPVSIAAIVGHFGSRSFGAVLLVFSIPNLLPMPPGASTVLGLPLLVVAPQLAGGARRPWLPKALGRRTVDRDALAAVCKRASPWVARAERLTTRRLDFMFGTIGDAAIGIVCTLLAAVLILPIPLGNLLPAAAVATLALSLVQRDGLLAMAGFVLALVSAAVLAISWELVVAAIQRLGSMTGLW